ncbi:MAG: 2,3-bisphosphoglycerate-independent phosphoglycerate mutase [Mycoplasmatales bacterium]
MKDTLVLTILDGLAFDKPSKGNAVTQANKPTMDKLWKTYSHTTLRADGLEVGLPEGQMGNSEVGHLNIGAGRKIFQSLVLINNAIEDGSFNEIEEYVKVMEHVKENNSKLHIMGLLSDGGVHSHINHIIAMIKMAKLKDVKEVVVHAFLDGRDVDPKSAKGYIKQVQEVIEEVGNASLATVSGRYYAMDRDKRWDRVELAYNTIIKGESANKVENFIDYIDTSYSEGTFDEFMVPSQSLTYEGAKDNDGFIFMNFRPDRAIQLSGVITNEAYNPKPESPIFKPDFRPSNIYFVQTMKYSDDVQGTIAFKPRKIVNTFGEVVSNAGKQQLRIAETEKYPHVTFFFDGGITKDWPGAKQILINSPKVATYDLQPEMSAYEVTDALVAELDKEYLDVVILNFANPDMVGHSGMVEPTVKAIEAVDECLGKLYDKVREIGGTMLVTADHGNSERVLNEDGSPNTAHTINPVPFVLVSDDLKLQDKVGRLADIAPTMLEILKVQQPEEMTGESLIDG